ncbi:MAG: hypothetical protein KJZ65_03355 [Phycisphaerales bacterium]|nr:hypothetical protein [Phycisphaerales bacterium]
MDQHRCSRGSNITSDRKHTHDRFAVVDVKPNRAEKVTIDVGDPDSSAEEADDFENRDISRHVPQDTQTLQPMHSDRTEITRYDQLLQVQFSTSGCLHRDGRQARQILRITRRTSHGCRHMGTGAGGLDKFEHQIANRGGSTTWQVVHNDRDRRRPVVGNGDLQVEHTSHNLRAGVRQRIDVMAESEQSGLRLHNRAEQSGKSVEAGNRQAGRRIHGVPFRGGRLERNETNANRHGDRDSGDGMADTKRRPWPGKVGEAMRIRSTASNEVVRDQLDRFTSRE